MKVTFNQNTQNKSNKKNMLKSNLSRSSPTHSKSAKSIKSKIHQKSINQKQEINKGPYFRPDPIRDQINDRLFRYKSKSQNSKYLSKSSKKKGVISRINIENDQNVPRGGGNNNQSYYNDYDYYYDSKGKPLSQDKKQGTITDNTNTARILNQSSYSNNANTPLNRANNIVQDLLRRHQEAKQRLKKLKQERQKQIQAQYPFTPQFDHFYQNKNKNKSKQKDQQRQKNNNSKSPNKRVNRFNSNKYQIGGDIIRRNQIWLMQKKKKQIDLQEKAAVDQMRHCTFSPEFSSKKQSQFYLKNRAQNSNNMTYNTNNYNNHSNISINHNHGYGYEQKSIDKYGSRYQRRQKQKRSVSPQFGTKKQRDYTQIQYQMAKRGIINKLMGNSYF